MLTPTWLEAKLDLLAEEYLTAGEANNAVFEAQFLAYLECLSQMETPCNTVWQTYRRFCQGSAFSDQGLMGKALVEKLVEFRARVLGAQVELVTRKTEDWLEFLTERDDASADR